MTAVIGVLVTLSVVQVLYQAYSYVRSTPDTPEPVVSFDGVRFDLTPQDRDDIERRVRMMMRSGDEILFGRWA